MSESKEIENLVNQILYHQSLYYNEQPEITDAQFDALWDRLKVLDPTNDLFTKKIGKDESKIHQKIEHIIPMGSQQKATTEKEIRKWATKYPQEKYIVEPKCDGISVELQYQNGKFVRAVSRGDGKVGDDITITVSRMCGLVKKLNDTNFTGSVRGEILMSKKIFEEKYPEAKNPRNMASGIAKRKDGIGAEDCFIMVYDTLHVSSISDHDDYFKTEIDKITWMNTQGFNVVDFKKMTIDEIIDYRKEVVNHIRDELDYEIDGLVIKLNEIDNEDMKRERPDKQIAFKFPTEYFVSKIIGIEWSISGKNVTPVGLLDPVEIAGTTVKRASLSNPDQIRKMKLMIGSTVMVSKRGEIIPKIESLVFSGVGSSEIHIPEKCDSCGSDLVNEWTSLYCPNEKCDNKLYGRLKTWIKRLGIKNFGDLILGQLYDRRIVRKIQDLYTLKVSDLVQLDRVGEKSAIKALNNLNAVKEITLPLFIAGFNIDGVGESTVEMVVDNGYNTLEKIRNVSIQELSQCHGVGGITARLIKEGIESLYEDMLMVLKNVTIARPQEKKGSSLSGKSFCFTGKLNTFKNRTEAENIVKENGGEIKSGVSSKLNYLVSNTPNSGSNKNKKAKKLGVSVITEDEFLGLIKNKKPEKPKNGLDQFF